MLGAAHAPQDSQCCWLVVIYCCMWHSKGDPPCSSRATWPACISACKVASLAPGILCVQMLQVRTEVGPRFRMACVLRMHLRGHTHHTMLQASRGGRSCRFAAREAPRGSRAVRLVTWWWRWTCNLTPPLSAWGTTCMSSWPWTSQTSHWEPLPSEWGKDIATLVEWVPA